MMAERMIELRKELFLGKGKHKAAYIHPEDPAKCIKVPFHLPDTDIDRELEYREVLKKNKKFPSMLTQYFGTVMTNEGVGYVYERVQDFDGKTSLALKELFATEGLTEEHLGVSKLEVMKKFRDQWLTECIVTSDTDFVNYFAQRITDKGFIIRIIDNIGSPSKFQLAYYFEYFAKKRAYKYWERLMERYIKTYCEVARLEEAKKLL